MAETINKADTEKLKMFKKDLKRLLALYGYKGVDRILIHLGESNGIKGCEITKYV